MKQTLNVDQVRDTVRTQIKVGMEVKRGGRLVGHVTEVCGDGCVVYRLRAPRCTGSDERDDAGIVCGTKLTEGILDMTEIACGRVDVGGLERTVTDRWELI